MLLGVPVETEAVVIPKCADHLKAIAQAAYGKCRCRSHISHSFHRSTHWGGSEKYSQSVPIIATIGCLENGFSDEIESCVQAIPIMIQNQTLFKSAYMVFTCDC